MCCRYYVLPKNPALSTLMEEAARSALAERFREQGSALTTGGEVRPADVVPVLASNRTGGRSVFPMRWGYRLEGRGGPLVNARTETAAVKPTFREAWEGHRCAVPASWYYEWKHETDLTGKRKPGRKYSVRSEEEEVLWLCGLYRIENGLPAFVILTRAPTEALGFLHDRMPFLLPKSSVDAWINPASRPETLLPFAYTELTAELAD